MLRRSATVALVAVLLSSLGALPARASSPPRLHLDSYAIDVFAPLSPASVCDSGSLLNCGGVAVSTTFSGLTGRARPAPGPAQTNLVGSVRVARVYGCQTSAGRRLHRFDRRIEQTFRLDTRRGFGFSVPASGDTLTATTYAFLSDSQPGNCPGGTQGMTYAIRATNVKLRLVSLWAPIPSADYRAPGRAQWRGAVPAPVPLSTGVVG